MPLKSPVKLDRTALRNRKGLILQLIDEQGRNGFGEIAPFPGFSRETLDEAESETKLIITSGSDYMSIDNFPKKISNSFPSIKFGFESAVLDLKAKYNGMRICSLLSQSPLESISVNGLLAGGKEEILKKAVEYRGIGYKAVKLKVGSGRVEDDIELTKLLREIIGNTMLLRLDANRAWQISDAKQFRDAVAECNIDYLEEPLVDKMALLKALSSGNLHVPIALDETTREISPDKLREYNVKAIVLKPTLLGLQNTLEFAKEAHKLGITPVIGSSFESGLGLSILAQMAAAVNSEDIPVGLDTYSWFADNIIRGSLPVKNGRINLTDLADSETVLDSPLLKQLI